MDIITASLAGKLYLITAHGSLDLCTASLAGRLYLITAHGSLDLCAASLAGRLIGPHHCRNCFGPLRCVFCRQMIGPHHCTWEFGPLRCVSSREIVPHHYTLDLDLCAAPLAGRLIGLDHCRNFIGPLRCGFCHQRIGNLSNEAIPSLSQEPRTSTRAQLPVFYPHPEAASNHTPVPARPSQHPLSKHTGTARPTEPVLPSRAPRPQW